MATEDDGYMARAVELARSAPHPSPNPRVGAVVVRGGRVIGEGLHEGAGTPHAERRALAGIDARGASLYCTLEPCAHLGRTPPCVPAIVEAGIARVVVAIADPDPRVAGRGLAALRAAGIEITAGVLADDAAALNEAYLHHRSTKRPLVRLKLAMSIDGRLAAADGSARWISSPAARRHVHLRRAAVDAVMVGAGTVRADGPLLTARDVGAQRQPLRVVVDAAGGTPPDAPVLNAEAPTLVATTDLCPHDIQTAYKEAGAEVAVLERSAGGVDLVRLIELLGRREVLEVMCEGGARLATALLRAGLVDRLEVHRGPVVLGDGGPAIGDVGVTTMAEAPVWVAASHEVVDDDVISVYRRRDEA